MKIYRSAILTRTAFGAVFCLSLVGGQSLTAPSLAPTADGRIGYDIKTANLWPVWSGGALNVIENNDTAAPRFLAFDRTGRQVSSAILRIPLATKISVNGFGRTAEGVMLICGQSWDDDGREAAFISWISPDGKTEQTVRTSPYTPYRLAVAPDGSVWTVGLEYVNRSEKDPSVNVNAGVIRHFDSSGKAIGAFLPRSLVPRGPDGIGLNGRFLAAARDRVGWISENGRAYVEVSSDGAVKYYPGLARTSVQSPTGLALTEDGGTFLSTEIPATATSPRSWRLYQLDHARPAWVRVVVPGEAGAASWGAIYGAEGNMLAWSTSDRFLIKFFFVGH